MQGGMPPDPAMMMGGPPPMGPMGPPPMGPPPMDPSGAPMDPMMGGMGMPPVDPMQMLLEAVMGKWGSQEAQLAGEQGMLMDTLSAIATAQPPMPQEMFAEGAPTNAGMVPEDDFNQLPMPPV